MSSEQTRRIMTRVRQITSTDSRPLGVAVVACFGWYAVALFDLYLKNLHVVQRNLPLLTKTLGNQPNATLVDYLYLFRQDLALFFIGIPLLVACAWRLLPAPRLQLLASAGLSVVALLLLFVNMHSWGTVGHYVTINTLRDALAFGWSYPSIAREYVDSDSRQKLLALMALVVFWPVAATRLGRMRVLAAPAITGGLLMMLTTGLAACIAQGSELRTSPANTSFFVAAATTLVEGVGREIAGPPGRRAGNVTEDYRQLTQSTPAGLAGEHSPVTGKAAGHDLIVFVMETGAARFADFQNDLGDFPTIDQLSRHGLVLLNHRSSFPATSEALFSVFSGMYPTRSLETTCIVAGGRDLPRPIPGFVSWLAARDYVTALYSPDGGRCCPLLGTLIENLGFAQTFESKADAALHGLKTGGNLDLRALDRLERDLQGWIRRDQRYAAVFLPQVGHGPFSSRPPGMSIIDYAKSLAVRQDAWLGRLVDILRTTGRLDKTVILVVGDHGVRTTLEDPSFNAGFIDDYAFHVAALLYAPTAFPVRTFSEVPTSHIDVSPSLADLFGIDAPRASAQGLPFWNSAIAGRTQLFLANWTSGADGYCRAGTCSMYTDTLGMAFENHRLTFDGSNLIASAERAASVKQYIDRFYDLQSRWVDEFVCR